MEGLANNGIVRGKTTKRVLFYLNTGGLESFLKNETDILFYLEEHVKQIPGVLSQKLFTSKIYLITDKDDILAKKILSQKVIYMAGH